MCGRVTECLLNADSQNLNQELWSRPRIDAFLTNTPSDFHASTMESSDVATSTLTEILISNLGSNVSHIKFEPQITHLHGLIKEKEI